MKKLTILMYAFIALACLGPLVGWFTHEANIQNPNALGLAWAAFASWSAVWVVSAIAAGDWRVQ